MAPKKAVEPQFSASANRRLRPGEGKTASNRDLQEQAPQLGVVAETIPLCVALIAADGTLLHINAAGLALIQAGSAEMAAGKNFYDLVIPDDRARFREFNAATLHRSGISRFAFLPLSSHPRWMIPSP